MEDRRRWEEMETNCMANIFQRLGLEELTLLVPFVCKSWYRASRDPLCWRVLDFRALDFMPWSDFAKRFANQYSPARFTFGGFMRFVVSQSHGSVVDIRFPLLSIHSLEDLVYASEQCQRLKVLALPSLMPEDETHMLEIVEKWKDLERLEMESKPSCFQELVSKISLNCKRFAELRISGAIKEADVLAIVKHLPRLKRLDLSKSYLPKEQLFAITTGCKELEKLTVRDCVGFEADDEVLRRAARIKTFEIEGSKLKVDGGYETDECDLYAHAI